MEILINAVNAEQSNYCDTDSCQKDSNEGAACTIIGYDSQCIVD